MFRFHGDNAQSHPSPNHEISHDGTQSHLAFRRVEQQLQACAYGRRILGVHEQPTQRQVLHVGNMLLRASLPGHKHTLGRFEPRIASPIRLDGHRLLASDGFARFEENCSPKLAAPRAKMAAAIAMSKIVKTILIFMAFFLA
jgi:hypothetical protein